MLKNLIKKWKLLLILLIMLAIAGLIIRQRTSPKPEYVLKDSTSVRQGELASSLTISGEIDAEEKVTLRFQTSGRLAWVGVKEGEFVKKYQGIASLDKRDVEKNLKKKLLAYMNERWDFEQGRDDKLVFGRDIQKMGELTVEERRVLEQAQFDLDNSVLDVEISDLAVQYANLWTPIDGLVTRIDSPFTGVNITPATAEFEIINPDSVYFSALADETEVTLLREQLSGELVLDAFPDETIDGTVRNISFQPKTGESGIVYEIKFAINSPNPDLRYRLGMVGDLTFEIESVRDALYLPAKYISSENGDRIVFMQNGKAVEKVKIKTGLDTDDNLEILSGLKKGDKVYLPE